MSVRPGAVLIATGLLLAAAACARALHDPPAVSTLAGRATGADVASLIARADAAWRERTPRGVGESADLYLKAAAERPVETAPWIGACRSLVWLAARSEDEQARRRYARDAVSTAQWCRRADATRVECDYWLALALGVQARERRSTGLDALPQIEELLLSVTERSPELDRAGAHRVLALLYLRAPGWPRGPGDHELGLANARRATELDPDYPPNQLALAEALATNGDRRQGLAVYKRALAQARRLALEGDPDAPEWVSDAEKAIADIS